MDRTYNRIFSKTLDKDFYVEFYRINIKLHKDILAQIEKAESVLSKIFIKKYNLISAFFNTFIYSSIFFNNEKKIFRNCIGDLNSQIDYMKENNCSEEVIERIIGNRLSAISACEKNNKVFKKEYYKNLGYMVSKDKNYVIKGLYIADYEFHNLFDEKIFHEKNASYILSALMTWFVCEKMLSHKHFANNPDIAENLYDIKQYYLTRKQREQEILNKQIMVRNILCKAKSI